ncbi:MAG TPA: entericidin A/B family lipoprotein [Phycisphaerales bacterium]|nr:entericidin A/B family lipoprotein [Phycisphaerales bacterium]
MITQHTITRRSLRALHDLFAGLACLAVALCFLTIPGCNTTKGVGKDVKALGEGVEKAADENGAD